MSTPGTSRPPMDPDTVEIAVADAAAGRFVLGPRVTGVAVGGQG